MNNRWNNFWYNCNYSKLDLLRICFGVWFFINSIIRLFAIDQFLANGLPHYDFIKQLLDVKSVYSFLPNLSDHQIIALALFLVVSSLGITFGKLLRLSLIFAFIINTMFISRNQCFTVGSDYIANYVLFYLIISYGLNKSVGMRFFQVQLVLIYCFAALGKLKMKLWLTGEAMWYYLLHIQAARFNFHWISHYPLLIKTLTYTGVTVESVLPILLICKRTRKIAIVLGLAFHLAMAVFFKLYLFESLMFILFIPFLDETKLNSQWSTTTERPTTTLNTTQ